MTRRLRWFAIGAAAVVMLAAVAVVVAIRSIDPDDLRALLVEQVRAATGRTLAIGGPVEWNISLSPAVIMPHVSFANMEGGSRPEMATVERIVAQVDLLALVRGTVHVRRLLIEGADILLETDAAGRPNWAFGESGAAVSAGAPAPLRIDEVLIDDAVLSWRDGAAKRDERFRLDRLRLEGDGTGPHELELDGVFAGVAAHIDGTMGAPDALLRGAPLPVDLELTVGGVTGRVAAAATLAGSTLLLDGLKIAGLGSDLAGTLAIDFGGGIAIDGDLKAGLIDVEAIGVATGRGTGSGDGGRPASDGRLFPDTPLPARALRALDAELSLAIGRIRGLGPELTDVSLAILLRSGALSVDPLSFAVAGSPMKGRLGLEAVQQGLAASLRLSGKKVDFGRIVASLGREGMVEERGDFEIDLRGRGASLRAVMASLDGETRVSMGQGRIANGYIELASGDLLRMLGAVGGSGGSTEVNCIVSRFVVKNGFARHEAFLFDTPGMTVGGTGDIDLREERLDLVFVPRSKRAGLSLETPIAVRGTLASPTVLPDAAALAEKIGTSVILNVINPLGPIGLLVPLVTGGSGDDGEACAKALDDARAAAGKEPESEGGIGGFIRGILGGDR